MQPSNTPTPLWVDAIFVAFAVVVAASSIGFFLWTALARCSWDEGGLRWRWFFVERRIPWEQISDYYSTPSKQQRKTGGGPILVIEAGAHKFRQVPSLWSNVDALKEAVMTSAMSTATRSWGIFGCRAADTHNIEFTYNPWTADAITMYIVGAVALLGSAWLIGKATITFPSTQALMGTAWALGAVAGSAVGPLLFGFMYCAVSVVYFDLRRRGRQRIIVSPAGIRMIDGNVDIAARWDEVTHHGLSTIGRVAKLPCLYIVDTVHGQVEFTTQIKDCLLLRRIISHRAPDAFDPEVFKGDVLGAGPSVARSRNVDVRVFHYRTRTVRALLWFCAFYAIMVPLAPLLRQHVNPVAEAALTLGGIIVMGWFVWRYRTAAVSIDNDAVTQYAAFGERRIAWDDVEVCRKNEFLLTLSGRGTTIGFFDTISDCRKLSQEIRQRAVNARFDKWPTDAKDEKKSA